MMLRKLILALTVMACAQPAFAQLTMGPDAIGPIKRSWTISDVLVSGLPHTRRIVPTEGDPITIYTLTIGGQLNVEASFEADDTPFSLRTESPVFSTREGAHVGNTLAELQAIYPSGTLFISEEEGLTFSFLPNTYTPGKPTVSFAMDTSALTEACIYDRRKCQNLGAARSVSFATIWSPARPTGETQDAALVPR